MMSSVLYITGSEPTVVGRRQRTEMFRRGSRRALQPQSYRPATAAVAARRRPPKAWPVTGPDSWTQAPAARPPATPPPGRRFPDASPDSGELRRAPAPPRSGLTREQTPIPLLRQRRQPRGRASVGTDNLGRMLASGQYERCPGRDWPPRATRRSAPTRPTSELASVCSYHWPVEQDESARAQWAYPRML
jgi:hypothetical protein